MIRTKKRMGWCIAFLVLNLAFIWGNSLLPGEVSGALSNWVGDILSRLMPGYEAGMPQEGRGLLRKLAHFSEFALLGCALRWLFGMLHKTPKLYLFSAVCGVTAAFVDEGIQMFVPDRGPGLLDVGIDSCGVVLGIVLLTLIHRKVKSKNLEETKK
ncbi:MAG: VanZ family protein [Oscillospiraceae bacterium]|nr:VanZ family protein [Oscillospiraceae bacterium]